LGTELLFEKPVLLIVAHWEDEIIHAGSALLTQGKDWTMVCATICNYRLFTKKHFETIGKDLGARTETLNINQRPIALKDFKGTIQQYVSQVPCVELTPSLIMQKLLNTGIYLRNYATIITHGFDGDINGHIQHKQLAKTMSVLVSKEQNLYHFSWNKLTKLFITITPEQYEKKMAYIRLYKPFENRVQHRPEFYIQGE